MRVVMTVSNDAEGDGGTADLRRWLTALPELRGRVDRADPGECETAPADTMGAATDALVAVLEPGGVAAVFAGGLVAWVQTRRSSHTITVTRPDGTVITISSRQAGSMTPEEAADLAERLARPGGPDPSQEGESSASPS
ncbi:hypothetical protein ABZ580_32365 [Streptomyces sp. NPDC012486]|uniref:effector-associated constant component EACC1 n=2 Tax=Streptomyces TaxID=1883 RepID=UPI0026E07A44|nr:hypothetical protein [Streptomyces sp. SNU607]WKV82071.1 hypothetical protein HBB06_30045 [Streptomyces sp. SNU607]